MFNFSELKLCLSAGTPHSTELVSIYITGSLITLWACVAGLTNDTYCSFFSSCQASCAHRGNDRAKEPEPGDELWDEVPRLPARRKVALRVQSFRKEGIH